MALQTAQTFELHLTVLAECCTDACVMSVTVLMWHARKAQQAGTICYAKASSGK